MTSGLPRLSAATLRQARAGTVLPAYAPAALQVGIVHLGLGAFVRAHMATYTDDVLAESPAAWGIAGVSLQRSDQRDRLAPQDGLYVALQRDRDGMRARVVACIRRTLVAPEDPSAVIAAMAPPTCRIVSLTITEMGYCHDPGTGRLDADHPLVRRDLAAPDAPGTAVGLIVAALRERRARGVAPPTVLCCDNLPHNGRLVAGLVRDFAALLDDGLAGWIEANVAFPSTMVDRIVPAATEQDMMDAAQATGLRDAAPVSHERFRQWVIEDRFVDGNRPPWEAAGAELVTDVAPYEHMKLRLLNGTHSALAYLGYLAGRETIADAVADEALRGFVGRLWREDMIPVVPPLPGVDLHAYATTLPRRFANPAIRHRTWQIAMDGSQKLPQRLLSTIRERRARALPIPRLSLAVAAWLRYADAIDETGQPIDVRDPLAQRLRAVLDSGGPDPARRVADSLTVEPVFGIDLPRASRFVAALTDTYASLLAKGARAAAEAA
ncbi:MAG: mannitol dehydrogenase family protein [Proteobacteria bacterium]|nr:mannitol dehydrogenase family protein [Pseudomonadota bacterium]